MTHRIATALGILVATTLLAACGTGTPTPRLDQNTPSANGVSPSSRGEAEGRPTIRSALMRPTWVRLPVPSADLTDLVRVEGDTIEALATKGAFFGRIYPVISTNDGAAWRIDGPLFYRAAADGANATDDLAVSGNGCVVAWGRTGSFVKTRAAGQTRWRATDFLGGVRRVTISGRRLYAHLYPERDTGGSPTYVSRDDGVSWQLSATSQT